MFVSQEIRYWYDQVLWSTSDADLFSDIKILIGEACSCIQSYAGLMHDWNWLVCRDISSNVWYTKLNVLWSDGNIASWCIGLSTLFNRPLHFLAYSSFLFFNCSVIRNELSQIVNILYQHLDDQKLKKLVNLLEKEENVSLWD